MKTKKKKVVASWTWTPPVDQAKEAYLKKRAIKYNQLKRKLQQAYSAWIEAMAAFNQFIYTDSMSSGNHIYTINWKASKKK